MTNMTEMFERCTSLTDVSALNNWHTNNVKYMWAMFRDCKKLKTLNLSNWNTSNVIDMGRLFDGCNKLETIYAGT
ncbi:BspA family leucine-rich repeat surface protein [bacterium]|nr:BspA family leucine-rich repeat surface protein [bacterium]